VGRWFFNDPPATSLVKQWLAVVMILVMRLGTVCLAIMRSRDILLARLRVSRSPSLFARIPFSLLALRSSQGQV